MRLVKIIKMDKNKPGYILILLVSIVAALTVYSLDPIAQDIKYHQFADKITYFSVSNFWNVVSNIPFLLVGLSGLYSIYYSKKIKFVAGQKAAYVLLFSGISVVFIGSSYYHLRPDNLTLVWDRLPMTVAFMSLFSIIISEFISVKVGKVLLWPLVIAGVYSVYYWHREDDLRLYALVQFLPIILIPLILVLFKPVFTHTFGYWLLLLAYVIAKLLEYFDLQIFNILVFISGHSLKHIFAALGVYLVLVTYNHRNLAVYKQ